MTPEAVLEGAARARYAGVVVAIAHSSLRELSSERLLGTLRGDYAPGFVVDVRGALPASAVQRTGAAYWCL